MSTTSKDFIDGLTSAARDNPLAAALIGGGALWLALGAGGVRGLASVAGAGVREAGDAAISAARTGSDGVATVAGAASSAAGGLFDAVGAGATAARQTLADGLDRTTSALKAAPSLVPNQILPNNIKPDLSRPYNEARAALSDLFEQQPLVLGAIGLAIGAGIASAVAATASEKEWFGETSGRVTDTMRRSAGDLAQTAHEIARDVGGELQGAASEAIDTLGQAGQRAAEVVRSTINAKS